MGGDWPWFVWLVWPPFFNERDWQWATDNAPCWLTLTC